jgi:hypothetical protein
MTITAADTKIKVISKEHNKSGNGAKALDSLLKNKTVAAFRASLAKKGLAGYASWTLRFATKEGLVKLEA